MPFDSLLDIFNANWPWIGAVVVVTVFACALAVAVRAILEAFNSRGGKNRYRGKGER